jgi:hypothetical protein
MDYLQVLAQSRMTGFLVLVVVVFAAIAVAAWWQMREKRLKDGERADDLEAMKAADTRSLHDLRDMTGASGILVPVPTSLILKDGEKAYCVRSAGYMELRAVRHSRTAGAAVRVAKGLTLFGARGRGHSTEEMTMLCRGVLTVTNQRLVFDGDGRSKSYKLAEISSIDVFPEGIEVSSARGGKDAVFKIDRPRTTKAIIMLCLRAKDLTRVSRSELDAALR